jgi:hypothetical protein
MTKGNKAGQSGRKGGSIIEQTLEEPLGQHDKPKKHKKTKKQSRGK